MASIRKRNGKYQALVRRNGVGQIGRSFLTRKEAERWARQTEVQIESGVFQSKREEATTATLREVVERYIAEITPKKRGASSEKIRLKAISRDEWTDTPIAQITSRHIAEFRDKRLKSVCGSTVRREMLLLRHVFEVAKKEWRLSFSSNPLNDVSRPASNPSRERRLSEDEFRRLFVALHKCRNADVIPAVKLAIATGMRRGEMLSLNWEDINWQSLTVLLRMTKNGSKRIVPLSAAAADILMDIQRKSGGSGRVFTISAIGLRLAWERAIRRSGIKDYRFHDMRHEAISRFFELGLSVPEVALISGHKTAAMLFRYTHLRAEDVGRKLRNSIANTEQTADGTMPEPRQR